MRIGIDARMMGTAQATGVGSYIYNIVSRILAQDQENEYVLFVMPQNIAIAQTFSHPKLKIITTAIQWYTWQEQLLFPWILYKAKLDILHVPQFNVPLLYKKSFVVTIHDLIQKNWRIEKANPLKEFIFHCVFDHAVRRAKVIFTVSHHTKTLLKEQYAGINENKVIVTHLGVDKLFEFQPNFDIITTVKQSLGITKPYLLFLGVHRPHKNLVNLVQAFVLIKKSHDLQLVLAGPRDERYTQLTDTLNSLSQEIRNDILMPGFVKSESLPSLYHGATAYIVPSFEEGFGLNGLEAMQCGVPVLASNSTCLQEIYTDAAYYFDPSTPQSIANAFETLASQPDLRANLIARGHARVAEFDWNTTATLTHKTLIDAKKNYSKPKESR